MSRLLLVLVLCIAGCGGGDPEKVLIECHTEVGSTPFFGTALKVEVCN
jgi:hypothetical protein